MYGTVARLHIKPGMEARFQELQQEFNAAHVPGSVTQYVYRMDNEEDVYYLAVIFENKAAYTANANSPEQNERFQEYSALLASEPEWHDGEIVYAGKA
jgi:antibiotic biosynthesis monooxygenase (ABM) superfamily enzyme